MIGVRPVFALITATHVARLATSVAPDSPSITSTSATGGKSPAPSVPTALDEQVRLRGAALGAAEELIDAAHHPGGLDARPVRRERRIGVPVPSLTRAMAKSRPESCTEVQSMVPWNSETSTPSTVLPPAQTVTGWLVQPTFSALPSGDDPQPKANAMGVMKTAA